LSSKLCDDSFEEHVLPYPPEKSGLHLHGINESVKGFKTLPPERVDAFAAEWGFITTMTTTINSIDEVKAFTDEIGKTGKWNGEALEGFVVRTHVKEPTTAAVSNRTKTPYTPGSSFFFKIKYDEPYMMYRDWREVTKILLSAKVPLHEAKLPKAKLKRPETKLYVKWVTEEIKKNRSDFAEYSKGKGIIGTREKFLEWMAGEEGKKGLKDSHQSTIPEPTTDKNKTFGKTIIVPVAIPGCGMLIW
jgi:tRNA ligase